MKMRFVVFTCLFALTTLIQSGCGGRDSTVVVPPANSEPEDMSAKVAEENPVDYGKMGTEH